MGSHQPRDGGGGDERRVTVHHQHIPNGRIDCTLRRGEGVACAGRVLLHGETRSARQVRQQGVRIEGDDYNGVIVSGGGQRGENMVDDGQTANGVEWLGEGRTHPGACSGGQDYRLPRTHRPVGHRCRFGAG